uniref:Uncharacterized protein n=1 Tax=viral metagenome TaxID=1070528 RepID=A0A6H2A6A2_9ZZZZ
MEDGEKYELFSYLSQEYDIQITAKDIYEIDKILEGDCKVRPNFADLKKEYEECFMVLDRVEMVGTAVNAKLNDVFEWIEQNVKHDYSRLPTNEEIELWALETYKEYEDSRWFEPLKIGAMWMRGLVVSVHKGEI